MTFNPVVVLINSCGSMWSGSVANCRSINSKLVISESVVNRSRDTWFAILLLSCLVMGNHT